MSPEAMAAIRRGTSVKYGHTSTQFRRAPRRPTLPKTSAPIPGQASLGDRGGHGEGRGNGPRLTQSPSLAILRALQD